MKTLVRHGRNCQRPETCQLLYCFVLPGPCCSPSVDFAEMYYSHNHVLTKQRVYSATGESLRNWCIDCSDCAQRQKAFSLHNKKARYVAGYFTVSSSLPFSYFSHRLSYDIPSSLVVDSVRSSLDSNLNYVSLCVS